MNGLNTCDYEIDIQWELVQDSVSRTELKI